MALDTIRVGGGLEVEDRDLRNWFLTKGATQVHSTSGLSPFTIPPLLNIQGATLASPVFLGDNDLYGREGTIQAIDPVEGI